jgi:hypothetical protein
MTPARAAALVLFFAAFAPQELAAAEANATEGQKCLTREQRRAAIVSRQAVPLAVALRAAHGRRGDLLNARLCDGPKGLVYLLTLLGRDGKVSRVTVEAEPGKAEGR